jgi:4-amino-4-deoxy-L-arabinose transferase-like glycosyltransferase
VRTLATLGYFAVGLAVLLLVVLPYAVLAWAVAACRDWRASESVPACEGGPWVQDVYAECEARDTPGGTVMELTITHPPPRQPERWEVEASRQMDAHGELRN